MSEWQVLFRARQPIDPDYPSAPACTTLWLDNLGGLVLGMDEGDGAKRIALPITRAEAEDLAIALCSRAPVDDGTATPPRTLT